MEEVLGFYGHVCAGRVMGETGDKDNGEARLETRGYTSSGFPISRTRQKAKEMNGNSIHTEITFEQWKGMDSEQRDYHMFRSLQAVQKDIGDLKSRKKIDSVCSVGMGFLGGFSAMAAKMAFWK